jgi:hypothetical protein
MDKTKIKQDKNAKTLNTSNTQSLVQYCQKQYLPQWSRHSVARQKIRAASAGDLSFVVLLELIGSLESPPSNLLRATRKPDILVLSEIRG